MELSFIPNEEVVTSMKDKLQAIEEDVAIEKKKTKDCRTVIKKSFDSLYELLNNSEELLDEAQTEVLEPVLILGGPDDDRK